VFESILSPEKILLVAVIAVPIVTAVLVIRRSQRRR
jgi:hypothetical protein